MHTFSITLICSGECEISYTLNIRELILLWIFTKDTSVLKFVHYLSEGCVYKSSELSESKPSNDTLLAAGHPR